MYLKFTLAAGAVGGLIRGAAWAVGHVLLQILGLSLVILFTTRLVLPIGLVVSIGRSDIFFSDTSSLTDQLQALAAMEGGLLAEFAVAVVVRLAALCVQALRKVKLGNVPDKVREQSTNFSVKYGR